MPVSAVAVLVQKLGNALDITEHVMLHELYQVDAVGQVTDGRLVPVQVPNDECLISLPVDARVGIRPWVSYRRV